MKEKKQPIRMDDNTFQALQMMLRSPWYKWHNACGMQRPKMPWNIPRFIHMVNVTKMAIKCTLSYDSYTDVCIPNVDATLVDGIWSIDVTIWGKPEGIRLKRYTNF